MKQSVEIIPAASLPSWKTKWPKNGDLKSWFLCMLDKCDAIEDPDRGSTQAHLPIEGLVELGHVPEALKQVDRFLKKQPTDDLGDTTRMGGLGAQICLDRGDRAKMEKYLTRVANAPVRRKCDLGYPEKFVRDFRARNGILDPADAIDDEQRVKALMRRGQRRFREAQAAQQLDLAKAAIGEMEQALAQMTRNMDPRYFLELIVQAYADIGDSASVQRYFKKLNKQHGDALLDYRTLWKVGLPKKAIERATKTISERVEILEETTEPNTHFDIFQIAWAIEFLLECNEFKLVGKWLKKIVDECDSWPLVEINGTSIGIYRSLSKSIRRFQQVAPSAASKLNLKVNLDDIDSQTNSVGLEDSERLEALIAKARKLRSPRERQYELSKLFAHGKRWKELAEICSQVKTPEEAAELCWHIKFHLPGGEVKR